MGGCQALLELPDVGGLREEGGMAGEDGGADLSVDLREEGRRGLRGPSKSCGGEGRK